MLKTWAMLLTALIAVQAMGLQLLCFCGHCPISVAVGIAAEPSTDGDHSCCAAHLDEQAAALGLGQLSDAAPCCGDDHQLHNQDANLQEPSQALSVVALAWTALALTPWTDVQGPAPSALAGQRWARGPPDAPPPRLIATLQHRLI